MSEQNDGNRANAGSRRSQGTEGAGPLEADLARLGGETYVSLATFRRNGKEVRTPVWIARSGERLYVFSEADAGKVKRIRATKRVRIAGCNMRGGLPEGVSWADGVGRVVGADESEVWQRAYGALHEKYGWQMKIGDFFSRLTGRYDRRAMLEIALGEPATI